MFFLWASWSVFTLLCIGGGWFFEGTEVGRRAIDAFGRRLGL